jgi:hypothetical protein
MIPEPQRTYALELLLELLLEFLPELRQISLLTHYCNDIGRMRSSFLSSVVRFLWPPDIVVSVEQGKQF